MSDPFQDVDSAGIEFAEVTAKTMEIRQSEPVMEKIVNDYLIELEFTTERPTVELLFTENCVDKNRIWVNDLFSNKSLTQILLLSIYMPINCTTQIKGTVALLPC